MHDYSRANLWLTFWKTCLDSVCLQYSRKGVDHYLTRENSWAYMYFNILLASDNCGSQLYF